MLQTMCAALAKVAHLSRVAARFCSPFALLVAVFASHYFAQAQNKSADFDPKRPSYQINIALDFDNRKYEGWERVRWTNQTNRATKNLYFHLYPNLRPKRGETLADADEPRLEVSGVQFVGKGNAAQFSFDDEAHSILKVSLREQVAAGARIELELKFNGGVPEIDADETSLTAHLTQQIGAALNGARETRRARDINFRSRGVMLLGAAYPILAARTENGEWQRKAELSIGDYISADAALYQVGIHTALGVSTVAPCDYRITPPPPMPTREGEKSVSRKTEEELLCQSFNLRTFPLIVFKRDVRGEGQEVEGVHVLSVWTAEHERIGRRALDIACEAVKIFSARFGKMPLQTITIAEAPLVAGFGVTEFSGFGVVASAYYVDFDSPAFKLLPELVREQRSSFEDSLEFTVARAVAHQWWGAVVGNDPARDPFLDESLAHWSAYLYFQDRYGAERASQILEDQLRGVYSVYRAFGGEDMAVERPTRDFLNGFQYAAIISGKGALMFERLRAELGDERFFAALKSYYAENQFGEAEPDDLINSFLERAPQAKRAAIESVFDRWLAERHGDEDVAPPNAQLAAALNANETKDADPASKESNAFARLGKFFWKQMTKIR